MLSAAQICRLWKGTVSKMEILDIVDEFGNPTGETIEREEAHRRGVRHRSAHVWLVRRKGGRIQILLQKRSRDKDSFPGCYDISSAGHIPAGADFEASALRELREELGVRAQAEELIFCGQRRFFYEGDFYGQAFLDRQVSNVYLLWLDREAESFSLQREEVEAVRWFDFDECMESVRKNTISHCIYLEELQILRRALYGEGDGEKEAKGTESQVQTGRIRPAVAWDLGRILNIYEFAREYMRENGNPNQWNGSYPPRELLEQDIQKGQLYVYEDSQGVHGVFAFIPGSDPTYGYIEDGAWLNEEPYAAIHRLAGDGSGGIFRECMAFCRAESPQLRADTHRDNRVMQHLLEKHGFVRCGIIYLKDGSPRIAYQLDGR